MSPNNTSKKRNTAHGKDQDKTSLVSSQSSSWWSRQETDSAKQLSTQEQICQRWRWMLMCADKIEPMARSSKNPMSREGKTGKIGCSSQEMIIHKSSWDSLDLLQKEWPLPLERKDRWIAKTNEDTTFQETRIDNHQLSYQLYKRNSAIDSLTPSWSFPSRRTPQVMKRITRRLSG